MPMTKTELIQQFNTAVTTLCNDLEHSGQILTCQRSFQNFVNGVYKLNEKDNKNFRPHGNYAENLTDMDVHMIWIDYVNTSLVTLEKNSDSKKTPYVSRNVGEAIREALSNIYEKQGQTSPSASTAVTQIFSTDSQEKSISMEDNHYYDIHDWDFPSNFTPEDKKIIEQMKGNDIKVILKKFGMEEVHCPKLVFRIVKELKHKNGNDVTLAEAVSAVQPFVIERSSGGGGVSMRDILGLEEFERKSSELSRKL